jgi:hypothetical protein
MALDRSRSLDLALLAALLLGGCVSLPRARSIACEAAPAPAVTLSSDGRTASVRLDVLTYNVEGLPKMTRGGRRDPLQEVGEHLARLRAAGCRAPGGDAAGGVQPPGAKRRPRRGLSEPRARPLGAPRSAAAGPARRCPGRKNPKKGELGFRIASSGVLIAAEFPFVETRSRPFRRGSCAGDRLPRQQGRGAGADGHPRGCRCPSISTRPT